ncbi:hypothetical protein [Pseudonocardia spinosispora]|uniref:hypothetical protein n=1 Tax=Pseudonocardia spinosispora TaxID=103441 RepID=UPI0004175D30|nr:hypothetical protein [Pseudonocardia spinosispora]
MKTTDFVMQSEVQSQVCTTGKPTGVREMLLYEALARVRMREAEETARRDRMARNLVAVRRWTWLARYATQRAERLSR